MNAQDGHPAKPRTTPITRWVLVSIAVLIAVFALWLAWPKKHTTLPSGASQAQVYFISDDTALISAAATGEQDRWFGRLALPCGVTMWYVESAGTAMCATLGGPYGEVTVTSKSGRMELDAAAQQSIIRWATEEGGDPLPTRALLVYDGEPVGIVTLATPATAAAAG